MIVKQTHPPAMRHNVDSPPVSSLALGAFIACAVFGIVMAFGSISGQSSGGFSVMAWAAIVQGIVVVPLVLRRSSVAWQLVVLIVTVGLGLRALAVVSDWPDAATVENLFLRGQSLDWYTEQVRTHAVGLALATVGYLFVMVRARPGRRLTASVRARDVSPKLTKLAFVAVSIVALVAMAMYVSRTGGLSLENLSGKRNFTLSASGDFQAAGLGFLEIFISLPVTLLILLTSAWLRPDETMSGARRGALIWLGLLSIMLPLYASRRSDLIVLAAGLFFIFVVRRGALLQKL